MTGPITEIQRKLALLAEADPELRLFGAQRHKYALLPCLDEAQARLIEETHSIDLPADYRRFLLELGNGGAGPYLGLNPLEGSFPTRMLAKEPDLMSKPFPLTAPLYVMQECLGSTTLDEYYERIETDEPYYDKVRRCVSRFNKPRYSRGALMICDYGDAIEFLLVVKGKERGNIWIDDRAHDGGIFPLAPETRTDLRTGFLEWYERWLDQALAEARGEAPPGNDGYFEFARPAS